MIALDLEVVGAVLQDLVPVPVPWLVVSEGSQCGEALAVLQQLRHFLCVDTDLYTQ